MRTFFVYLSAQYLLEHFTPLRYYNAQLVVNAVVVGHLAWGGTDYFIRHPPGGCAVNATLAHDNLRNLAENMVGYQLFNTVLEVRTLRERFDTVRKWKPFAINVLHHLSAAAGAHHCLRQPDLLPHFAYYGCVTEWSTVLLIVIDFVRRNKIELEGCAYHLYLGVLVTFATLFLALRVGGWLLYTAIHLEEIVATAPGPVLTSLAVLTLLQLFWGQRVVVRIRRLARK
jgi:hypothetical protein